MWKMVLCVPFCLHPNEPEIFSSVRVAVFSQHGCSTAVITICAPALLIHFLTFQLSCCADYPSWLLRAILAFGGVLLRTCCFDGFCNSRLNSHDLEAFAFDKGKERFWWFAKILRSDNCWNWLRIPKSISLAHFLNHMLRLKRISAAEILFSSFVYLCAEKFQHWCMMHYAIALSQHMHFQRSILFVGCELQTVKLSAHAWYHTWTHSTYLTLSVSIKK
jgi:hypothetical protein